MMTHPRWQRRRGKVIAVAAIVVFNRRRVRDLAADRVAVVGARLRRTMTDTTRRKGQQDGLVL